PGSTFDGSAPLFTIGTALTAPGENIRLDSKAQARSSTSANFRRISPRVLTMAGLSSARRSVCCQALSNGSVDFMPCARGFARLSSALRFEDENRHPSRILRDRYCVRMRGGVSHPLHSSRY